MAVVGDLEYLISVNVKKLASGLESAENKVKGFGNKLSSFAVKTGAAAAKALAAGAVASAGAFVAFAKSSVEAYGKYEQMVGGAKLVYGEAYDEVEKRAQDAYKNVQMSANDYLQQVNGLAVGLKNALGGNERAAADLADRVITAEADVVSAMGISQEAAQNAFNGIMRGNYMMLDNLGVGIKGTKAGMEEVIQKVNDWHKANNRATKYSMDNIADQQSALVDYIEMVGLAGYAQKEGMDTLEGSLASTKSAWENLKIAIANPKGNVHKAVNDMIKSGKSMFNNFLPILKKSMLGIRQAFRQIAREIKWPSWKDVKNAAVTAWNGIKKGAEELGGIVFGRKEDGTVDWPTWDDVVAVATDIWNTIKEEATNLGGLVFGRKSDGSVDWPTWDDVFDTADKVWEAIKTGARDLGGIIFGKKEDGSVDWPTWEDVKNTAQNAWNGIKEGLESLAKWVIGVPELPTPYQMGQAVKTWWDEKIVKGVQTLLKWILGVPEMEDATGEAMKEKVKNWWETSVKPFLGGILDFTLGLFGLPDAAEMKKKIEDWWASVIDGLKLILGITPEIGGAGGGDSSQGLGPSYGQDPTSEEVGSTPWWASMPSFYGHAKGEWNVPYDNYPALLHRNETVLTSSQAREYREGGNEELDSIIESVHDLRADLRNLRLVVGEKTFGRAIVNYGGGRMDDYIGRAENRRSSGYGV